MSRSLFTRLVLIGVSVAGLAACSEQKPTTASQAPTNALEVMSWWTSGSEHDALAVLYQAFDQTNPSVKLTDGTVAGGGGSAVQIVLANRLRAGNPPDVWQTFAGAATAQLVKRSWIAELSAVYEKNGLASQIPKTLLDAVTVDGKPYGVSTGAHRGNMLWFNLKTLEKAGVTPPGEGYTAEAFAQDLAKIKKQGMTPLCLGGKDNFTSVELFENVLLGVVGAQGWAQITADRFDWNGPQVQEALRRFGVLLDASDLEASGLTWDQATKKLASGECAFESMNDSAYGELVKQGAVDGADFGYVPYPGTGKIFLAVVDTFVAARDGKNLRNAQAFLTAIGTAPAQAAFSKIKGSAPLRADVPLNVLPPYLQKSTSVLRQGDIVLSIAHGEAMGANFQEGFYAAVASFTRSRQPGAFGKTLVNSVNAGVARMR